MYPKISLKPAKAKQILNGHPWVFSGAIEHNPKLQNSSSRQSSSSSTPSPSTGAISVPTDQSSQPSSLVSENYPSSQPGHPLTSGSLCEVYVKDTFLGIGYYNARADIAIRILTRKKIAINEAFFYQKFLELKNQKTPYLQNTNAYRLVFAESDGLPGLIVDIYDQTLVLQFHTKAIENLHTPIVNALQKALNPACIYKKPVNQNTKLENLESNHGELLHGTMPENLIIEEYNLKFFVDIETGQKTGFFLDQRENRQLIMPYCQNRKVLNCFSYTGGFSIAAAKAGAQIVTNVDISEKALNLARKNFELNNLSNPHSYNFIPADCFDFLNQIAENDYDLIILDPPSFAKKRNQIKQAIKAYTSLNTKALQKLPNNGILITSSCTAHIDELTFIKILHQSACNSCCQLKVLKSSTQPIDHPYNLHFPEGRYLKFFILHVSR